MRHKFLVTILVLAALAISFSATQTTLADEPVATTVHIPTLDFTAPIHYVPIGNVNGRAQWMFGPWERGVGFFQGTAPFGQGNAMIGAHSTMPDGSVGPFYRLNSLQPGDQVIITQNDHQQVYVVTQRMDVPVNDISVAQQGYGVRLTIVTCTVGNSGLRTVVVAEPVQ
ncbi:MAG: sortase [Anaerolineales bacterium]